MIKVEQTGGACHTGHKSCFYRGIKRSPEAEKVFDPEDAYNRTHVIKELYDVINDRKDNPTESSYTASLYQKGENAFLKKLGEEATEIVMAAKDEDEAEIIYESADFIYHLLVVLVYHDIDLEDIVEELRSRRKKK